MKDRELLTKKEVAVMLRMSVSTVGVRLANRRKRIGDFPLPVSKPNKKCRWLKADIEQYIQKTKAKNLATLASRCKPETLAVLERFGLSVPQ